jgi:hypothetical protein
MKGKKTVPKMGTDVNEAMFQKGILAWDAINFETQEKIKAEVENIYTDETTKSIDDIFDKIDLPKEIIFVAITKLIEEGRIVEVDVSLTDILSIVRKISNDNDKIQNRLLSLAEASKSQKEFSIKMIDSIKEIKKTLNKVEVLTEIKSAIEKSDHKDSLDNGDLDE